MFTDLHFPHYWGKGPAAKLATGVKGAADVQGKGRGSSRR